MTSSLGEMFYSSCVLFYEKVKKPFLENLQKALDIEVQKKNKKDQEENDITVKIDKNYQHPEYAYCPKVICAVSKHPYPYHLLKWLECMMEFNNTHISPYK
jgi:hypothetical protein